MNLLAKLFKKSSCKSDTYGSTPGVAATPPAARRSSSALSFHCEDSSSDSDSEDDGLEAWASGGRERRRQAIDGAVVEPPRLSCAALAEPVVMVQQVQSQLAGSQLHTTVLLPNIPTKLGSSNYRPRRSQTFNNSSASVPLHSEPGCHREVEARLSSTSTRSEAAATGNSLSCYRHIHHRYRGSNCEVLEAISKSTAQTVMIKAFRTSNMTATLHERRCREVELLQAAAAAAVPNIMRFVATIETEDQAWTIVERSTGVTLIELMANTGGRLQEDRCRRQVALPLLQALAGLHALGVMHRHLKPEHLLCSATSLQVVDFTDAVDKRQHCLNSRVGDLHYMAPEVLTKPRAEDIFHQVLFLGMAEEELPQYDEKADVFSVGVILYEALTGQQPFVAETAKDMLAIQHAKLSTLSANGIPEFIAQQKLSLPAQQLLTAAMQENPTKRPSAAELLQHAWLRDAWIMPPARLHDSVGSDVSC